jgi:branched-chain amino acid transport system ATP-binding protein
MTFLKTEKLTKRFGDFVAVDNISLEIDEGSAVGFVGQNGAGKTTLLNLICGQLKPSSGRIYFSGEEISGLGANEIVQKGLTKSFQLTTIFPKLSVFENVQLGTMAAFRCLGIKDAIVGSRMKGSESDTLSVLKLLGLDNNSDVLAENLALGDKRRLEIAIPLATKPRMLLLDEPTAGMSTQEVDEMTNILQGISKSTTLMLVEHDIDVMTSLVDRIVLMHNGAIVSEGDSEEVLSSHALHELYLGETNRSL